MAITDATYKNLLKQVRIRQGAEFTQIPNLIEAGEELADGQFVYISDIDGKFVIASRTIAATHCVLKSANPRLTASEIAAYSGSVQEGEPVMAFTGGPGTVDIPIADDVSVGDELTLDNNGYATKRIISENAYVIGIANEAVSGTADDPVMGEAFITLPARYSPAI